MPTSFLDTCCCAHQCRLCIKRPIIFYFFAFPVSLPVHWLSCHLPQPLLPFSGLPTGGGLKIGNLGFLLFATIGLFNFGIFLPEEILEISLRHSIMLQISFCLCFCLLTDPK